LTVCYTNAFAPVRSPIPRDLTHGAVGLQASELLKHPGAIKRCQRPGKRKKKPADRNRALISPCTVERDGHSFGASTAATLRWCPEATLACRHALRRMKNASYQTSTRSKTLAILRHETQTTNSPFSSTDLHELRNWPFPGHVSRSSIELDFSAIMSVQ
jgi:hypothetical protein